MKKILAFFFSFVSFLLAAQTTDTTIYKIVEEMPRFPGCEQLDTTVAVKNQCAQTNLLLFFNRNIVYPLEARENNVQGQVVLSLVVEPDGLVTSPTVVRDIGSGCGDEALRVAAGMNDALQDAGLRWTPGKKDGKPVRTQVTLPIKFKLEDPKPYVLLDGRDTMFVEMTDSVAFETGPDGLKSFLENAFEMPAAYQDSCKVGSFDLSLYVFPTGYVRVIDMTDYWNLGSDFQWEAIQAATATWGHWQAATFEGRRVPASTDFTLEVLPKGAGCQQVVADYHRALTLAQEGSELYNAEQPEAGIAKLTEAIQLFPRNANFLYLRGQAYMNLDRKDEACADFRKVRSLATISIVEQLVPFICP